MFLHGTLAADEVIKACMESRASDEITPKVLIITVNYESSLQEEAQLYQNTMHGTTIYKSHTELSDHNY